MQTNSMKQALEDGETQVGVWINMVRNPAILRLMKSAGLDFARFDMEHASPSMETLSNMALLARAMDFTLTVRPPQGNREWITRILDAGVWSLHVPQVDTPEIAHEVGRRRCVRGSSQHKPSLCQSAVQQGDVADGGSPCGGERLPGPARLRDVSADVPLHPRVRPAGRGRRPDPQP